MASSIRVDLCGTIEQASRRNFDSTRQSTATRAPPSAANVTRSTAPLRTSSKNSEAAHRWSAGAAFALSDVVSAVAAAAKAARRPLCAWMSVLERGVDRCAGGSRREKAEISLPRRSRASAAPRGVERGMLASFSTVLYVSGALGCVHSLVLAI